MLVQQLNFLYHLLDFLNRNMILNKFLKVALSMRDPDNVSLYALLYFIKLLYNLLSSEDVNSKLGYKIELLISSCARENNKKLLGRPR